MKKWTKYSIVAVAASVVAVPLIAGATYASGKFGDGHYGKRGAYIQKMVGEIDADQSGSLTKAEVDQWRDAKMTAFDVDGDMNINLEEFKLLWMEQMHSRMVDGFQKLDEDGDGLVTSTEVAYPLDRLFDRLDRNEDGEIGQKEMKRLSKKGRHHHDDDDDDDNDNDNG